MTETQETPVKRQVDTERDRHHCHVFSIFPESQELFSPEINVKEIISRHGHAEWRAGVLTNELHGHLGIYAVIGVKMGVRATELLRTGIDDIKVTSYAGTRPPVSCINDGLQVSTGGTIGHGLFFISEEKEIHPAATFSFRGNIVSLTLSPTCSAQIKYDVTEGIRRYGLHTEGYWNYIRQLAIHYWEEFDRKEIFCEE